MKQKKIWRPLDIHQDHEVEIRPSKNAVHYAYYFCVKCQAHVSWISKRDANKLGWQQTQLLD